MSDEESEIRNRLLAKVYETVQLKVNKELDSKIAQLVQEKGATVQSVINKLDLKDFEEDLYQQCGNIKHDDLANDTTVTDTWTEINLLDIEDYSKLNENLKIDKSTATKLKAVRSLINSPVIEVNSGYWSKLSKNLQHCLIHPNNELYSETLKLHYKIIVSRSSSCEGYLSLIQALELLLNNRCFLVKQQNGTNSKLHRRVVQILKILLKLQIYMIKSCTASKQKVMDQLILNFIAMLCKGQDDKIVFNIICVLDSRADWFAKFCYCSTIRNIILKKISDFMRYTISQYTKLLNDSTKHSFESSLPKLSHCVYFLLECLKYEQGQTILFLHGLNSALISSTISKLKLRHSQNSETRLLLTTFITGCHQFITADILDNLIEPLNIKIMDKSYTSCIAENNSYIRDILNEIAHVGSTSSLILFGGSLNKKHDSVLYYKHKIYNPARTTVDFTICLIRNYINRIEYEHQIKESVIAWPHCCKNLYSTHPVSFIICNPNKLITIINDLYEAAGNYSVNLHYKLDIVEILGFFIALYLPTMKILSGKSDLFCDIISSSLLTKRFSFLTWCCIKNIAKDSCGYEILKDNHNQLLLPCFEEMWAEEDETNFMNGSQMESGRFLKVFSTISDCYRTFEALLRYENENTILENEDKPVTFAELLGNCFDTVYDGDFNESYYGLLVLKILISNANVVLHLESAYQLQENLNNLQEFSRVNPSEKYNSSAIIVDPITSLRHNILISVKYIGFVDSNLNEDILTQTSLTPGMSLNASGTFKRREKRRNELQKFLIDAKPGIHDYSWLLQARRIFIKTTNGGDYNVSLLVNLLEQVPKNKKTTATWSQSDELTTEFYPEDFVGVSAIVRFGTQIGLLSSTTAQCEENLSLLVKQFRYFVRSNAGIFTGFEWLLGILFLICSGNPERTKSSVIHLSNLEVFAVLRQTVLNENDTMLNKFYQLVAVILEDFSEVNAALKLLCTSAASVAKKWLTQCFFNVLPFEEICNFLAVCVLYPFEYSAYFVVAVFLHIKEHLFAAAQECNFQNIINMTQMPHFKTKKYLKFMDSLSKQYKNIFSS